MSDKTRDALPDNYQPPRVNHLLVIGIDDYKDKVNYQSLNNAVKDAKDFTNVLKDQYGFDESRITAFYNQDATLLNINNAFRKYTRELTTNHNLIIYMAGHGGFIDDIGFFYPYNAEYGNETTFFRHDSIVGNIKSYKCHHLYLVMDACFSGSLITRSGNVAARTESLDRLDARPSRTILCSGGLEPVADGEIGRNSPFARTMIAYLTNILDTNVAVEDVNSHVRKTLIESDYGQIPQFGSIKVGVLETGVLVLKKQVNEVKYWETILTQNTEDGYNAYLQKFAKGTYRDEAKAKIKGQKHDIAWQSLDKANLYELRRFLKDYPDTAHKQEVLDFINQVEDLDDWDFAKTRDTAREYRTYLVNQPKGLYRAEANKAIETLQSKVETADWTSYKLENTYTGFQKFMFLYGESSIYANEAKIAIAQFEDKGWEAAIKMHTKPAYKEYLDYYGGQSKHGTKALAAIKAFDIIDDISPEDQVWSAINAQEPIKADLVGYLLDYPDGKYSIQTNNLIKEIDKAADLAAWHKVKESKDITDLQSYLDAYPNGNHKAAAQQAQKQLVEAPETAKDSEAWHKVKESKDITDLQSYLDAYPNGNHKAEAQQAKKQLIEAQETAKDSEAWYQAKHKHSLDEYRVYLTAYPNGRFAADARVWIADLSKPVVADPDPIDPVVVDTNTYDGYDDEAKPWYKTLPGIVGLSATAIVLIVVISFLSTRTQEAAQPNVPDQTINTTTDNTTTTIVPVGPTVNPDPLPVAPAPIVQPKPVDADRDGIMDDKDNCPTEKGTKANKGCPPPDRDNDGVNDDNDDCPDTKGVAPTGCPKPKFDSAKCRLMLNDANFLIDKGKLTAAISQVENIKNLPNLPPDFETKLNDAVRLLKKGKEKAEAAKKQVQQILDAL
jgi:Caspase domain